MYLLNNIYDRKYKPIYPGYDNVIFDISDEQLKDSRNGDWKSLEVGKLACVLTSTYKVDNLYLVTGKHT